MMFCFLIVMSGCPEPLPEYDTNIKNINNSNSSIIYVRTYYDWNNNDTLLNPNEPLLEGISEYNIINPDSFKIITTTSSSVSSALEKHNGALYYFF